MDHFARIVAAPSAGSGSTTRFVAAAASALGATLMSVVGSPRRVERGVADSGAFTIRGRPSTLEGKEPSDEPSSSRQNSWTAARLKDTLRFQLAGQRVLVVANREPVIHEWSADQIVARYPASGLVTALEPVMRACSGVWIAHGGGSADRAAANPDDRVEVAANDASYLLRRVWLTADEERGYYYGFSNEALWPLCHLAAAQPVFRREDWAHYRAVNQRFTDAICAEADSDEPIVLVQDYHFALVPRMLRERFPRATILTFWHIPWPNAERFSICPYQDRLLDGLLGSSIVGFQTPQHCHNFLDSVDRSLEARVTRDEMGVVRRGWTTAIRAYPISVEWPNRLVGDLAARRPVPSSGVGRIRTANGQSVIVSVDRLD